MRLPANHDPRAKALFGEAAGWIEQGELAKAEQAINRHLQLAPQSWPGLCLKALIAAQTHRYPLAEKLWQVLLAAKPDHVEGYNQLGLICEASGRLAQAQAHFLHALALSPTSVQAHHGLATAYQKQGRFADAMQVLQQALANDASAAPTHFCIAVLLQAQGDMDGAVAAYHTVLAHDPTHTLAASNLLFCEHYLSQLDAMARSKSAKALGPLFGAPLRADPFVKTDADPERPLRIGVVSADMRQHPVGYFLEAVLRSASLNGSTWIAFSNSAQDDDLTARIRPLFAQWHGIEGMSDAAAAQCMVNQGIDILLDLSGHTAGNRLAVFAQKPAPIQVSWLGYFATTGLSAMDYVLADTISVPDTEAQFFSEKVLHLPHARFCFSPPTDAPAVSPLPVLSSGRFTFASFQDLAKINDAVVATWARIVTGTPRARLRIQSVRLGYAEVLQAFAQRLRSAGLTDDQFELLGPSTRADYFKAYADVDMVLDTFPYPGGTTTVEALWMGVPTLTLVSTGMLGRQGASVLANAGLPDWVCATTDTYVEQAISLASDTTTARQQLATLRGTLRAQVKASPLMDAALFSADLEHTFRAMWRAWCANCSEVDSNRSPFDEG